MDKPTKDEWTQFSEGVAVPGGSCYGPLDPDGQQQWSENRGQPAFITGHHAVAGTTWRNHGCPVASWQGGGAGVLGDVVRSMWRCHSAPERTGGQVQGPACAVHRRYGRE